MSRIHDAFEIGKTMGLAQNPVQINYAEHVEKIIECAHERGDGQAFVEAETGVGKTLGYLIPILLNVVERGERAIVSTYTIALQQQIMKPGGDMERALDIVEKLTGQRPSSALRIGMQNFVDPERVAVLLEKAKEAGIDAGDMADWKNFSSWANKSATGEIREWIEAEGDMPSGILPKDVCLSASAPKASKVRYEAHVLQALQADVLVTNHATMIYNSRYGGRLLNGSDDTRKVGVVLIDECDRLPDAAESAMSETISLLSAKRLLESIEGTAPANALCSLNELIDLANDFCPPPSHAETEIIQPFDDINGEGQARLLASMTKLVNDLAPLTAHIKKKSGLSVTEESVVSLYGELRNYLNAVGNSSGKNGDMAALRWSPRKGFPSLRSIMLNPSRILKMMWSDHWLNEEADDYDRKKSTIATALIMTSATIGAPSRQGMNFIELKTEYGIFDKENPCGHLHASFSPSKFGEAKFVYPDPSAPTVFLDKSEEQKDDGNMVPVLNEEWVAYAANMIAAAAKAGGRVLALTTSYQTTAKVCDKLRAIGINPIERERSRPISEYIETILGDVNSVFVSPTSWEGFDLRSHGAGESFKHVVICQLPYRPVDGLRSKAVARKLAKTGKSQAEINSVLYVSSRASALRKFRQGFGRGIRHASDHMTLWVADPRFPLPASLLGSPQVPIRMVTAHQEFLHAIPERFHKKSFKNGKFGSPIDTECGIFSRAGKLLPL